MSDLMISYQGFQKIDTTKLNPDQIEKKGISDKSKVDDNVLDISNTTIAAQELNTQDVSKVKFIKIAKNEYLSIDLSKPEQVKKLLTDLKSALLENGAVKKNFSGVDFQANTGIVIHNTPSSASAVTSENNQLDTKAHNLGQEMVGILDIAHSMTDGDYNRSMQNQSQASRIKTSYFNDVEKKLATQENQIDKTIESIKEKHPINQGELTKFEKLKTLNQSLHGVFEQLKVSINYTDKLADPIKVMDKLSKAVNALNTIDPKDIGTESYNKIKNTLKDYSEISLAFASMGGKGNADSMLEMFALKTNFRLKQITRGDRNRSNETKDIKGALNTFSNDISDMKTFIQRFQALEKKLANNEFKNSGEYAQSMLAAVPRTSPEFQKSVGNLAQAQYNSNQAVGEMTVASDARNKAVESVQSAFNELQGVQKSLSGATENLKLTQNELQQLNPAAARATYNKAVSLQKQADLHLAEYERFKNKGKDYSSQAEEHKTKAIAFLKVSEKYNDLVKGGRFSVDLKGETGKLDSQNNRLRAMATKIDADLNNVSNNFNEMDKYKVQLQTWNKQVVDGIDKMGTAVKFGEIQQKAQEMAKGGIDNAHQRLAVQFDKYNLSDKAKQYMKDPSSIADNEKANIREELTTLFKEHPELAKAVASEMTILRSDFSKQRTEMEKKFGKDSPQVQALNSVERSVVEGWMKKDGVMIEAMIAAGSDSDQVKNSLNGTVEWIHQVQDRFSKGLLSDKEQSSAVAKEFDQWMHKQPEMQETYKEFESEYGKPINQVPIAVVMDNTGKVVNFNAYVFKDGDTFKVFNPLDKQIYKGKTQDEALGAMAEESRMANGTMHYKDSKGVKSSKIEAPADTFMSDIGMGLVGLGGGILLLVPEPTTATKWAGGGMIAASSVYFGAKGTAKIVDLVQHEHFGNNAETWGAVLDVSTGMLGAFQGAGVLLQAGKVEASLAQNIVRLSQSSKILAADKVLLGSGAALASKQLYDIYNNDGLSTKEKYKMGSVIIATTMMPLAIMSASHKVIESSRVNTNIGKKTQVHEEYIKQIDEFKDMIGKLPNDNPQIHKLLETNILPNIKEMKKFYESSDMTKYPELKKIRENALAKLNDLEISITNSKLETHESVMKVLSSSEQTISKISKNSTDIPKTLEGIQDAISKAKHFYESEPMNTPPEIKKSGLEKIKALEEKFASVKIETHENFIKTLENTTKGLEEISNKTSNVETLINNSSQTLKMAKDFYNSPLLDGNPQLKKLGLEKVKALEDLANKLNTSPTLSEAPSKTGTYKYDIETNVGKNAGTNWASPTFKNVPSPVDLAGLKGTNRGSDGQLLIGAAGFDESRNPNIDLAGSTIEDMIKRVPADAQLRELKQMHGAKGLDGFEYSWNDKATGDQWVLRFHEKHSEAPAGGNSQMGRTFVIEKQTIGAGRTNTYIMDNKGNFHTKTPVNNATLNKLKVSMEQTENLLNKNSYTEAKNTYDKLWDNLGSTEKVTKYKTEIQEVINDLNSGKIDPNEFKSRVNLKFDDMFSELKSIDGLNDLMKPIRNIIVNNRSSDPRGGWVKRSDDMAKYQDAKNQYENLLEIGNNVHIPESSNPNTNKY